MDLSAAGMIKVGENMAASQERKSQSRVSEDPGGPHTQASASSRQLSQVTSEAQGPCPAQALPWIPVNWSLSEA